MNRIGEAFATLLLIYALILLGYRLRQFVPGEIAHYHELQQEHDELVREKKIPRDSTLWQLLTFQN